MHFSKINILRHHRSNVLHHRLDFLRSMGGGPRTFPGGLNKWQWKRMHEKKAREKEKRLLQQEKQIYEARVRSQIRAKLENPESGSVQNGENYGPISPEQHIKVLADRFMKEGAEDLWNENDGPLEGPLNKPGRSLTVDGKIDLKKLIGEVDVRNAEFPSVVGGGLGNVGHFSTDARFRRGENVEKSEFLSNIGDVRRFSTYLGFRGGLMSGLGSCELRRKDFTSSFLDLKCYYSVGIASDRSGRSSPSKNSVSGLKVGSTGGNMAKWPKFRGRETDSSDDESDDSDEDEEEEGGMRSSQRIYGSSAALGKYDKKTTKRVPLKFLEEEDARSRRVEDIRRELSERKIKEESEIENVRQESILSTKRFDECGVCALTVQALTEAGYVQMTRVQETTLSVSFEGKDAFVKSKSGTGKSIAFLLPAIETVLKASSDRKVLRIPPIYVLILCPTREIASQIAAEANVLLKHHKGIGVQSLVGGTRFKDDQRRLETDPSQIIVATPGRLLDHIENKSGISARLMGLQMLILDEADHLLDLGFRKDIEKIVDCLPRKRQSLLFSATVPKEVRRVSQLVLKREHAYIDTVGLGCLETPAKVKQSYVVAPHDQHLLIVHHLLKSHISEVIDYKVIVFCATSMMTSLMYALLREMKLNVREIHSKKPQLYCDRVSSEFKESKRLILITSDVSVRGINYPDVTLVIQVGVPPDRGQYIHRLGRTGRQGKEGEGVMLLAPWEEYFLDEIKDLPLEKRPLPQLDPDTKVKMEESMGKIDSSLKEAAYHAWLGYYNSISAIGRDKTSLVELANEFSASIGLEKPPTLFRKTALKMGLKGIPGIRIHK